MKKFVIIGNGIAAAGCIEGIRRHDADAEITVVSAESVPVYCRPLISYYLEGRTDLERINYRSPGFYEENGCTVLYGRKAAEIKAEEKTVVFDDGTALSYDALCVATGSVPFVPRFGGLETVEKKTAFMTLEDALYLENEVTRETRVLVAGGGMIGLKCAESLRDRAKSVTVCDMADRILPSVLDKQCADLLQARMEENGIAFLMGDGVDRFEGNRAVLKSGAQAEFDILVLAVGVRPDVSLVKAAGGETDAGIVTDEGMRSSLPDVFAAGDCAQSFDVSAQREKMMATFPNAYIQGFCAGESMAGGDAKFKEGIALNSIGFYGLQAMTAGTYFSPEQGGEAHVVQSEAGIKKLFTKDGYLTGFMIVGDVNCAGIYTRLIRERVPLDSIDFEQIKNSPSLLPLGADFRGNRLGGVIK